MIRTISIATILFAVTSTMVQGQAYPVKPIRVVVPFPPGGGVDFTARLVAQRIGATLGQPIIIENRAGAGGAIAEDLVAKSVADGYTILYSVGSDMITRKFLSKAVSIDPLKDLTPVATAIMSVNIVAAGPKLKVESLRELLDMARKNPGKLSYGSSGVTSYHHLIGELLKQNGIDMVHVPYKGLAPALVGLLGEQTDIAITNFATVLPQLKEGRVKALAVVESGRYPSAADIPAMSEELKGFNAPPSWFGFFGPAGLPLPIVARLNNEVKDSLESSEVNAKIRGAYLNVLITPVQQMRPFILATSNIFERIVKAAGIQPTD
ncbi:MAG: tripartite tricarboxylate transporter substrate binding protein [Betaproteobacteria bacterium]|nr:tripartite tricarboxylate transporter substrate binding protein [Betaproteobacteria bacterium]